MASVPRALLTAVLAAVGVGAVLRYIAPATSAAPTKPADPFDRLDDLDADDLSPMQMLAMMREFARMDGESLDDDPDFGPMFGDLDGRVDGPTRR